MGLHAAGDGAVLSVTGGVRRFGSHTVLNGVDLTVGPRQIVAVVGANGSGKSTLLRVFANVLRLHGGTRTGPAATAFLPAVVAAPPVSVMAWIRALSAIDGSDAALATQLLELFGFDATLDTQATRLSTGNLRKMFLAATLCTQNIPLILDEPVASLDVRGRDALASAIHDRAAKGVPVLIADHDRHWLDGIASSVHAFHDGRLHDDTAASTEATIRLSVSGPRSNRDALMKQARSLGFDEVD